MAIWTDWRMVVDMNPQGLKGFDRDRILYGPVKSVDVDKENIVTIELEWVAQAKFEAGVVSGWFAVPRVLKTVTFPNGTRPFEILGTKGKDQRIGFNTEVCANFLYIDQQADAPKASDVEGLVLPPARLSIREILANKLVACAKAIGERCMTDTYYIEGRAEILLDVLNEASPAPSAIARQIYKQCEEVPRLVGHRTDLLDLSQKFLEKYRKAFQKS